MEYKIGVFGSAGGELSEELQKKAKVIGEKLAEYNCIVITGNAKGLPEIVSNVAKVRGSTIIGFSPAENKQDHIKRFSDRLASPHEGTIYTASSLKGRNIISLANCEGAIYIAGRTGTLNEATIAYDTKVIIGTLTDTGGESDMLEHDLTKTGKKGSKIISESDPETLVDMIIKELNNVKGD